MRLLDLKAHVQISTGIFAIVALFWISISGVCPVLGSLNISETLVSISKVRDILRRGSGQIAKVLFCVKVLMLWAGMHVEQCAPEHEEAMQECM